VRAVVDGVSTALGLDAPIVRMSKLGPKLYLEVDYLVEAGRYDTAFADQVRHALNDGLKGQPLDVWLNVELSTDGSW
jgi:predicted Co/Zn/Cd cation transporter (cation efflux family)